MSLTIIERRNTKKELAANFNLAGVTLEQAAQDLATTPEHVEAVCNCRLIKLKSLGFFEITSTSNLLHKGRRHYLTAACKAIRLNTGF